MQAAVDRLHQRGMSSVNAVLKLRVAQWLIGRLQMRRYRVLFVILAVSLLYFLIQYLFLMVAKNEEQARSSNKATMDAFLKACAWRNMSVTIMEPNLVNQYLRDVLADHPGEELYCERCDEVGRRLTVFAIESYPDQSAAMFEDWKFQVHEVKVADPRLLSVNSMLPITGHYFLQLEASSHIIHVVVLYARIDGRHSYMWHSPIRWSDPSMPTWLKASIGLEDLSYGVTAGVYKRFQTYDIIESGFKIQVPEDLFEQRVESQFLECNHTRARLFEEKYGHVQAKDSLAFIAKVKSIIIEARQVLEKLDVRFWLSSGNCLGWYRQCGVIPYSQDVDFGILSQDTDERIIPAFQGAGFKLKHVFGKVSDSYELSFVHMETGLKLDLFFFYEEQDYTWNGGTEYDTGKKFKYYFPPFTLCWTEMLELKLRIPCETQSYVEANYGKNWFEPVKVWDWKKSPANVKENGVWPEAEWDNVIQVYDTDGKVEDIGLNFHKPSVI